MDQFSSILLVVAAVVPAAVLIKTCFELYVMPRAHERGEYDFAYKLGQNCADPRLVEYAEELGYRMLINDPTLTTSQRKVLLTLPDRARSISRYLKTRGLLTVSESGPVLRWKRPRHQSKLYRQCVVGVLASLYMVFCMIGFPAIFGPYPPTAAPVINAILKLPTAASLYFIFLGAVCLFNAIKLSAASTLVMAAAVPRPFRQ